LDPLVIDNIGIYQCLAFNSELNKSVTRRINLNTFSKLNREKKILDFSDRIKIKILSDENQIKKNGKLAIECSVG
jgi:hypothetical protein